MTLIATRPPGRHREPAPRTTKVETLRQIALACCAALLILLLTLLTHHWSHAGAKVGPQSLQHAPLVTVTSMPPTPIQVITPTAAPSVAPALPVATPSISAAVAYVVKPGDNLTVIAAWFHVPLQTFYAANMATVGANWNLIYPGQVLMVVTS